MVISSIEGTGIQYAGGSIVDIITDKTPRSIRYNLLESTASTPLEFDLSFICIDNSIQAQVFTHIKSWLCGQLKYQPLVILHPDLEDIHFNCIFNNAEDISSNGYRGLKVTAICDAGGAWKNTEPKSYNITNGKTLMYFNASQNNDYTYPEIEFTMENSSNFSITNTSDKNRTMLFEGLLSGETITIKESGEIISSITINRVGNFNKKYLRFLRGYNELVCSAGASELKITHREFIRLGGG